MIRSASDADAEVIATVLIESRRVFLPFAPSAHSDHDVRQWVRNDLMRDDRVFVWNEGGLVIAVLAISAEQTESWINQLYVLPGCTGQGIGSKLLRHAHGILPLPIHLYTFQQNFGARRFYERSGYRAVELTDGRGNEERCPDVHYVHTEH